MIEPSMARLLHFTILQPVCLPCMVMPPHIRWYSLMYRKFTTFAAPWCLTRLSWGTTCRGARIRWCYIEARGPCIPYNTERNDRRPQVQAANGQHELPRGEEERNVRQNIDVRARAVTRQRHLVQPCASMARNAEVVSELTGDMSAVAADSPMGIMMRYMHVARRGQLSTGLGQTNIVNIVGPPAKRAEGSRSLQTQSASRRRNPEDASESERPSKKQRLGSRNEVDMRWLQDEIVGIREIREFVLATGHPRPGEIPTSSLFSRVQTAKPRRGFASRHFIPSTSNGQAKKKAPAREASPAWDCEQGSLPHESSVPPHPDIAATDSSQITVNSAPSVDNEQAPSAAFRSRQAQNARRQHWLPWQDRFLVQEIFSHRPFLAPAGKAREEAWDKLAVALLEDSAQSGSAIDRTGDSCRSRFKRLVDAHKSSETRSLQKTGTNEEIDGHIETMTELVSLLDAQSDDRANKSLRAKGKEELEAQAALELRDAAMKGRVLRQALTDVTQLEDSTLREKAGQRESKSKRQRSTTPPASEPQSSQSKENLRPTAKRICTSNQIIEAAIQTHQQSAAEQLAAARELDKQRHEELMAGFNNLAKGFAGLTDIMRRHLEHDDEVRKAEQEARARESERLNDMLRLIFLQKPSS
ncbi:hypothetical protein HYPSUDRAFT_209361 [Hypholoma sublateritium FD-334 SS-4]|uniref:Myb-like domain-containing protein n=1 Tax=Hypholoma sublateritium (strain FD-334 SS-4) TaxID=945553 RepID=A0A0D2NAP3_HYPSF|nr:hypothetical protein HYPSUDRAFT_209361 [Hypholoma sublateritium FD-334 SS-4]